MKRSFPVWLPLLLLAVPETHAQEAVRLREEFPAGYQYHVSCRVELSGELTLPPPPAAAGAKAATAPAKPLTLNGASAIEYDERILEARGGPDAQKTVRIYRRVDFQRQLGGQPQESTLRPAVRRLVLLRTGHNEVPFSPDGPMMLAEIDLVRTDVFTPALAGLLPARPVRPGDRWAADAGAVRELTDLEKVEEGQVECRLEQLTTLEKRRHARVAFRGTVRGVNEDGPNRQQLDGYFFFDLESNHLSYLYLRGVNELLDKDGKAVGRVEGRFVLTRQAHQRAADLGAEALRGFALEPSAENTLLLYDNPDLGLRFLHPRRWRVARTAGRQIALEEPGGNGVLLTADPPEGVPTGAQFLAETQAWLAGQKAKVLRGDPPRAVQAAPRALEYFGLEVEVGGQRAQMDYYVAKQAAGGATLAARLLLKDLAAARREVEQMAHSVTISPWTKPGGN